jgi:hypothetical protein
VLGNRQHQSIKVQMDDDTLEMWRIVEQQEQVISWIDDADG